MYTFDKLKNHYKSKPPKINFGEKDALGMQVRITGKFPFDESTRDVGPIVWRKKLALDADTKSAAHYGHVDICLDFTGDTIPETIPLPSEMKGQKIELTLYLDELDCVRMRAIGGYLPSV